MASLLMAIFVWFASLFAAAETPRHEAKAHPAMTAAKAPAVVTALPGPQTFANLETLPARWEWSNDAVTQLQDGNATMTDALAQLQTIRVTSASGHCDRVFIVRGAKMKAPQPPQPLSPLSRNS